MRLNGIGMDDETRCVHFALEKDIIAIKFKCCLTFYPCYSCHEELNDHDANVWSSSEFDTPVILCGKCKSVLTINEYLTSEFSCPNCDGKFNPKCSLHYNYYFEV